MATTAPNYLAGWAGSVTIGTTPIAVTKWTATENNSIVDVTGTLSLGKMQYVKGLSGVTWSIDGIFDGANPPTARAGDIVAVSLLDGSGTEGFTCTTAILDSFAPSLDVAGSVSFTITGRSNGSYTYANV